MLKITYGFLNVLKEKRRCAKIVDRTVEKSLNLFLMQIHGNEMIKSGAAHHFRHEFGHDASSFAHLTCIRGFDRENRHKRETM